jgi:hypothetical protein
LQSASDRLERALLFLMRVVNVFLLFVSFRKVVFVFILGINVLMIVDRRGVFFLILLNFHVVKVEFLDVVVVSDDVLLNRKQVLVFDLVLFDVKVF